MANEGTNSTTGRTGIIVVIVAVLVGLLLLGRGYDNSSSEISGPGNSITTVAPDSSTTIPSGNVNPADVKVKVANATNVVGLATKTRDSLLQRGYTSVSVGDSTTKQEASTVFYAPGAESAAAGVAQALGLAPTVVGPLPNPSPVALGDAVVLVMAGLDL